MKVNKIEDIEINSKNFCIYGRNGSGKTTLISSMPRPMVIVDINEKGLSSIPLENRKDIYVINIESVADMSELVTHLKNKTLNEALGVELKSIAFDTITQFREMFEIYAEDNKNKFLSNNGNFDKFKVYNELNRISKILMSSAKSNDLNVSWIFQEKAVVNDMGDVAGNTINATSGMKNIFLSETDVVLRTLIKTVKDKETNKETQVYGVSLQATENNDVKVRSSKDFAKGIANPTWEKINKEIN